MKIFHNKKLIIKKIYLNNKLMKKINKNNKNNKKNKKNQKKVPIIKIIYLKIQLKNFKMKFQNKNHP